MYNIPTLAELYANHLARLESSLGQTAPSSEKAFLKVLAADEAGQDIGLYKFAADRVKQNLAITATGDDLDLLGQEVNCYRKSAQTCILVATLIAITGTVIPTTIDFIASNGLYYRLVSAVTAVGGVANLTLKCTESGLDGSLDVGDTLQLTSQITGAQTTATVTSITQVGMDKESDTDYRPRVIFAQRAITGGGSASDHKMWAEAVTGVKTAFPYSGSPTGTSYPGDRTVYIEATSAISSDGIAPAELLASVRSAINTDPDTGKARPCLGLTDSTLFINSISRTSIYVTITGSNIDSENVTECKAAILEALTEYFLSIKPYNAAIDASKNNIITAVSVSKIVQSILITYGAYATAVTFGTVSGTPLTSYTVGNGELCKLAASGGVVYA